jgi:hypothetical protein
MTRIDLHAWDITGSGKARNVDCQNIEFTRSFTPG